MHKLVSVLALLVPLAAWSHGDWPPKHGGTMNKGGETSFEMVPLREGLKFYISDHGEDVKTGGSEASLSLKRGDAEKRYVGRPAGRNEIFFPKARVGKQDSIRVRIKFENGSVAVGRFAAKHVVSGAQ